MPEPELNVRVFLDHLNAFLADAYSEPRRVSDLLHAAGLSDQDIEHLRRNSMESFLQGVRRSWSHWLETTLVPRYGWILVHRYGLDGQPPATLADLGHELGISRERVRQLEEGAMRRLRRKGRLRELEQCTAAIAREVLTHDSIAPAAPSDVAVPAYAEQLPPSISVQNLKLLPTIAKRPVGTWPAQYVYIGPRNSAYRIGTDAPLANPHDRQARGNAAEHERAAQLFAADLAAGRLGDHAEHELDRLVDLVEEHGSVVLVCWCKNANGTGLACHGDVIKAELERRLALQDAE